MAYEEDEVGFSTSISRRWIGIGVIGIILLIVLISTLYSIGPDEEGVIKRFGRYVRVTQPGLHVKVPFVETVDKVKVKHIFKEEFGFRTLEAGVKTLYAPGNFSDESLMLTGDLNVAVVEWIVQYKVKDPINYLFKVRNPRATIRVLSEAVMRRIAGDRSVDEVLTVGRIEVGQKAQEELQRILDTYEMGIQVVTIKLKDVNPPDPVKPSFNEVNEAKQERERTINEAWQAYNKVIPRAKGEAEKTISTAEGYAVDRVNKSLGEANRFMAIWEEYRKAKDVTRRRLYLETLSDILPRIGEKYVIDKEGTGILPLVSLGEKGGEK